MSLFEAAKGIMRSDGNMTQWAGNYPPEELVRSEIERGVNHLIVADESDGCAPGTPLAVFSLIIGPDPTYSVIRGGKWLDDSAPYGTIHRLASGPESHGIARFCFDWCFSRIGNIRIDTHADNRIMQRCILSSGFTYCGVINIADGTERLAYQKII